jgi:hypothetical protein
MAEAVEVVARVRGQRPDQKAEVVQATTTMMDSVV